MEKLTQLISMLPLFFLLLPSLAFAGHDYGQALSKSIMFFEAQRSGVLPHNQRVSWRSHSGLQDGKASGVDLVGGYYDAGDNVKFGLPMAFTVTMMSWSIIEYGKQMASSGELGHAMEAVKWGTDYFIKAHPEPNVLYGEVGDRNTDRKCWQRPEDMTTDRHTYKVDPSNPGSDLAGETAAAMAAASIVFRRSNPAYSHKLFRHAYELFNFADKYRGKYYSSITVGQKYYRSISGYNDELLWAAAWLYQASNNQYYLDYLGRNGDSMGGTGWQMTEFSWDVKYPGVQTLVAKFLMQGKAGAHAPVFEKYLQKSEYFMCSCLGKGSHNVQKTPGGLIYRQRWNNLQFVTSASFLATVYSDYLVSSGRNLRCDSGNVPSSELLSFAKSQVDYILGDNPRATSYMVGYGNNFPQRVHHRGSSIVSIKANPSFVSCFGGYNTWFSSKRSNTNLLTGAIVGGPDAYDDFADERKNYEQTEPATYNNAPLLGVLARLSGGHGGYNQLLPVVVPAPRPIVVPAPRPVITKPHSSPKPRITPSPVENMVKHHLRESIKSLFGSHIDPDKEEQLRSAKTETEEKVKRILKLIKDDNPEEDGTTAEILKREPLAELIEDFHNQYQLLYTQYDNLTGELKNRIKGKREKENSSSSSDSDSDSDYSSKGRDSKNGQLQNESQKIIDGLKQELEVVHQEVAELDQKLTVTREEKEDINSKHLAALSKIHEADKINMDLKTDAEALGIQRSKLLAENTELIKQLDIASKVKAELSQRLEDMKIENKSLATEKETALQQFDEEKKITDDLRNLVDQLKDDKLVIAKELQAVTGELSSLKQKLEHAEEQITTIIHNLEVTKEEDESLKAELSKASNEVQQSQNRIQEFVSELSQLKEKLDEREREVLTLTQMHEGHRNESSNLIRELEAQITNLGLELESLQNQKKDMEEQLKRCTTDARELEEHNLGLRNQISEHEMKSKEREVELSAVMKKLRDEASSRVQSITNELNVLQQEVESLQHQKSDLEVQLLEKSQENSECLIKIQSLKEEVGRKTQEQERLIEDRGNLTRQLRDLELEMSTLKSKNSKDEEQIRANIQEISHLQDKIYKAEEEASGKIIAFTAQVDNLQKDLLSLQETKEELDLFCEKLREEHAQTLTIVDNEKNESANKIMDLQRTLKEQEDAHQKLNEEYKQVDSWFNECKVKLEVTERKIDEMAEEFREGIGSKDQIVTDLEHQVKDLKRDLEKKGNETSTLLENVINLEVKRRVSNQKLRVTKQLLSEKEESFRKVEEEFQQIQRELKDKIATLVATITANNEAFHETITSIKVSVNGVIFGIDTVSKKFSNDWNDYENSIANY